MRIRRCARTGNSIILRRVAQVRAAAWVMADRGASTAEYAMTMLAACAFAGVLLAIIRSGSVKGLLLGIIEKALSLA